MRVPGEIRPNDEELTRNIRAALQDSANSITVAWLASECRRARFQEQELRRQLEELKRQIP